MALLFTGKIVGKGSPRDFVAPIFTPVFLVASAAISCISSCLPTKDLASPSMLPPINKLSSPKNVISLYFGCSSTKATYFQVHFSPCDSVCTLAVHPPKRLTLPTPCLGYTTLNPACISHKSRACTLLWNIIRCKYCVNVDSTYWCLKYNWMNVLCLVILYFRVLA